VNALEKRLAVPQGVVGVEADHADGLHGASLKKAGRVHSSFTLLSQFFDTWRPGIAHDSDMKTLRALHLYLGCIFAPLLVFFSISGLWQTFDLQWTRSGLALLSSLHTGRGLKAGGSLSSPFMKYLIAAMALSLVLTVVLGIVMAFRFGHRRNALICLVAGVVVPVVLALVAGRY
jgi:hypothetical protein